MLTFAGFCRLLQAFCRLLPTFAGLNSEFWMDWVGSETDWNWICD
jgi:hypothetical protein